MIYLVDTDRLIDYLQGDPTAIALLQPLFPIGVAISIITFSEVYEGIYSSADPRAAERAFRAVLESVAVLPFGRSVAKRYAALRHALRVQGRSVRQRSLDLMIASTALDHNLTLITRNVADYGDISGLSLLPSNTA